MTAGKHNKQRATDRDEEAECGWIFQEVHDAARRNAGRITRPDRTRTQPLYLHHHSRIIAVIPRVVALALVSILAVSTPPRVESVEPPEPGWVVLAADLVSPDGMTIDPRTDCLYVAEEDAAAISRVQNGRSVRIIDGRTLRGPVWRNRAGDVLPLRSPEGLAMDTEGSLYVAEDVPGGRLLRFRVTEDGEVVEGEVVELPGRWPDIAWECVRVDRRGRLILAGSSLERVSSGRYPRAFRGVILFRDEDGRWALLAHDPFVSYSGVDFHPDGVSVWFACEVTGDAGIVPISGRAAPTVFRCTVNGTPEDIYALDDGRAVVAVEQGELSLVDPALPGPVPLRTAPGSLESVRRVGERFAVSLDGLGAIAAIPVAGLLPNTATVPTAVLAATRPQNEAAEPTTCPRYLRRLLDLCAVDTSMPFDELLARVPIVALHAQATLFPDGKRPPDPVVEVQFVVVQPNYIDLREDRVRLPVSAIAARTSRGRVVETHLHDLSVLYVEGKTGVMSPLRPSVVPVPFCSMVSSSDDGLAVAHFAGLGEAPDFHFLLDREVPENSFMVVTLSTGTRTHYRLHPIDADSLVISPGIQDRFADGYGPDDPFTEGSPTQGRAPDETHL